MASATSSALPTNGEPARPARGMAMVASAAVCWGGSAALARAMFTGRLLPGLIHIAPLGPMILSQARVTLAACVLVPVVLWRGGAGRLRLPGRDLRLAALLGLAGMALNNVAYYVAIQRTNVATAIVLQYTAPVMVLAWLAWRRRQRPTPALLLAAISATVGVALAIGLGGPAGSLRLDPLGVAGALVGAIAFAFYNLAGRGLTARAAPVTVSCWMLLSASAAFLLVQPPWMVWRAHYSLPQWAFLAVFSLTATLAPTLLYIGGLRHLEASRAVITSCLEPVAGIACAWMLLGEGLSGLQLAGVGMVLTAVALVQTRPYRGSLEMP